MIFYHKYKAKQNVTKFKDLLDSVFVLDSLPASVENINEIKNLRASLSQNTKTNLKVKDIEKNVYSALLDKVLDDKKITPEEKESIEKLESITNIDENFETETKTEIFRLYYLDAIADREITDDELSTLNNIAAALKIPSDEIKGEMAIVDEIVRMQNLRIPLTPLDSAPVKIQKSEMPFYSAQGKVLSRKKAKKGSGRECEYSVKRDGKLVVTNKRLLVVDEGTTAIRLSDVLEVDVDLDNKLIVISKQSSSIPIFIETKESLYCGRIIDLLSQ